MVLTASPSLPSPSITFPLPPSPSLSLHHFPLTPSPSLSLHHLPSPPSPPLPSITSPPLHQLPSLLHPFPPLPLHLLIRLGMLGSVDANTGSPDLGWDTDQFPMDVKNATLLMKVWSTGGNGPLVSKASVGLCGECVVVCGYVGCFLELLHT